MNQFQNRNVVWYQFPFSKLRVIYLEWSIMTEMWELTCSLVQRSSFCVCYIALGILIINLLDLCFLKRANAVQTLRKWVCGGVQCHTLSGAYCGCPASAVHAPHCIRCFHWYCEPIRVSTETLLKFIRGMLQAIPLGNSLVLCLPCHYLSLQAAYRSILQIPHAKTSSQIECRLTDVPATCYCCQVRKIFN